MARNAPGRTVGHVIPLAALADRHDVIGVHLSPIRYATTVHALPMASVEYRLPPRLMGY